jgi:hypothetical protein
MQSNNNLFKFSELFCEAMGIESLVLKEDEIVSFLKKYEYITPYDENKDRYVVTKIQDAQQKMSSKLCDFFNLPNESILTKTEIMAELMDYMKEHNLQNPNNSNEFISDEKLKELFSLKDGEILTYRKISSGINNHITSNGTSRIIKQVHEVVYNGNM